MLQGLLFACSPPRNLLRHSPCLRCRLSYFRQTMEQVTRLERSPAPLVERQDIDAMTILPRSRKRNAKSARKPAGQGAGTRRPRRPDNSSASVCPIGAMGASAGGLEAFERFFGHMPSDSGMAFVVVPHLDVHHKSAMTELLRRYTRMEVVEITDGMAAIANRVH